MIKHLISACFFLLLFTLLDVAGVFSATGRIYGKIYTEDGDVYEGRITWDKNEGIWEDILDCTKSYRTPHYEGYEKEESIEIFGLRISWSKSGEYLRSSMGIKFGHIQSIRPRSKHRATIYLKSGDRVKVKGYGTDIGSSVRRIVVEDQDYGKVRLEWSDLDKVIFETEPEGLPKDNKIRLFGKLVTRDGDEFLGFITWDHDEIFSTDILDGEEDGRDWEIPFKNIEKIKRRSRNSATVFLKNGEEIDLSGTNDVNSSNRGILVKDFNFGRVEVEWGDFGEVKFLKSGEKYLKSYDEYDGGKPLYGTVYTEDGDFYTGFITWDDDEKYTWEMLDGDYNDLEVMVEFGQIKSIKKRSFWGAEIILKNGNTFVLENSNDVTDENKGIYIITDGKEYRIDWEDFERVEFKEK